MTEETSALDPISIDMAEILRRIPHRYPFLLVDRAEDYKAHQSITGIKCVTINEPYFAGHFPGNPLFPGVLLLEAMAQAAGLLMLRRGSSEGKTAIFMSADKVKFRKPVRPGDQLIITARLTKNRGNKLGTAECQCTVDGQPVASAELMFAILDEAEVD